MKFCLQRIGWSYIIWQLIQKYSRKFAYASKLIPIMPEPLIITSYSKKLLLMYLLFGIILNNHDR